MGAVASLLYKVVSFFCLKLKISLTTEPIGFFILCKLHIGPVMVLCYFIFRFKSCNGFKPFDFPLFTTPLNTEPLDARGVAASCYIIYKHAFLFQELNRLLKLPLWQLPAPQNGEPLNSDHVSNYIKMIVGKIVVVQLGILRDKTIEDKLIYITNNDKQNYHFF